MKLNLEKKSTMVSVGTDHVISYLAKELGCKTESLPIKYLGLPIGACSRSTSIWESVLERMEMRLALWKKKFLNKAGRLALIKSISLVYLFISCHSFISW